MENANGIAMCLACDIEAIRTDFRDKRSHAERHQEFLASGRPQLNLKNNDLGGNGKQPDLTTDAAAIILPKHHVDLLFTSLLHSVSAIDETSAVPICNIIRHLFTDEKIYALMSLPELQPQKVCEPDSEERVFTTDIDQDSAPQTSVSARLKQAIAEAKLIFSKLLLHYGLLDINFTYQSENFASQTKLYYEQIEMLKETVSIAAPELNLFANTDYIPQGGKPYHRTHFGDDEQEITVSVLVPRKTFGHKWTPDKRRAARMSLACNTAQAKSTNPTVHERLFLSASPPSRFGHTFSAAEKKVDELVGEFRGRGRSGTLERSVNTAPGLWYPQGTVIQRLAALQPEWPQASAPMSHSGSPQREDIGAGVFDKPLDEPLLVREVEDATEEYDSESPSKTKSQDDWWMGDLAFRTTTILKWDTDNIKHDEQGTRHDISQTGVKVDDAKEGTDYQVVPGMSNTYASGSAAVPRPRRASEVPNEDDELPELPPRNFSLRPIEDQYTSIAQGLVKSQEKVREARAKMVKDSSNPINVTRLVYAEAAEEEFRKRHTQVERAIKEKASDARDHQNRARQTEKLRQRKIEVEQMVARQQAASLASTYISSDGSYISDSTMASPLRQLQWTTEPTHLSAPARLTTTNLHHHSALARPHLTINPVAASISPVRDAASMPFPAYTDPFMAPVRQIQQHPPRPLPCRTAAPAAAESTSLPDRASFAHAFGASFARVRGRQATVGPAGASVELAGEMGRLSVGGAGAGEEEKEEKKGKKDSVALETEGGVK